MECQTRQPLRYLVTLLCLAVLVGSGAANFTAESDQDLQKPVLRNLNINICQQASDNYTILQQTVEIIV